MLGKIEGRKRKDDREDYWMASPTQMDVSLSKFQETAKDREAWRATVHGIAGRYDLAIEQHGSSSF